MKLSEFRKMIGEELTSLIKELSGIAPGDRVVAKRSCIGSKGQLFATKGAIMDVLDPALVEKYPSSHPSRILVKLQDGRKGWIRQGDVALHEGGTGAGAGAGSNPDFISVGKPKKSKTQPSGLKQMKDDELNEVKGHPKGEPHRWTPFGSNPIRGWQCHCGAFQKSQPQERGTKDSSGKVIRKWPKNENIQESADPLSVQHRTEMLKHIPKQIDQYRFLGKNDEGQWELTLPQHPEITVTATPFLHGSKVMKVIIEKNEDVVDEFNIAFVPFVDMKTKKLDPVRDAERYAAKMREELGKKLHPEELDI